MFHYIAKTLFVLLLLQTTLFSKDINIDTIIKTAEQSEKSVILYLHRIGCSYCNSMQEFTLDDDDVKEYIAQNYILVKINVSLKDTITYKGKISGGICLAKHIGYNFYPSILFLNKNADIEYASVGYKNETEFLVILQYFKSDAYKNQSLKEYKKYISYKKSSSDEIQDTRQHVR